MESEGTYHEIQLIKSDAVASLMEERHILDDDVKLVINNAEATGEKLYQPEANRYLAKMTLPNITFYVEYSISNGGYEVHTTYSHRSKIIED